MVHGSSLVFLSRNSSPISFNSMSSAVAFALGWAPQGSKARSPWWNVERSPGDFLNNGINGDQLDLWWVEWLTHTQQAGDPNYSKSQVADLLSHLGKNYPYHVWCACKWGRYWMVGWTGATNCCILKLRDGWSRPRLWGTFYHILPVKNVGKTWENKQDFDTFIHLNSRNWPFDIGTSHQEVRKNRLSSHQLMV